MSYMSDFLKELEKLKKKTASTATTAKRKADIAVGMQSEDKFTRDFFTELYKLEEEEALKKNQEKKNTRFSDIFKTRFKDDEELTTASQKRKLRQDHSGGGGSFGETNTKKSKDITDEDIALYKELFKKSKATGGGGRSFDDEGETKKREKKSNLYVDIGGGLKINTKNRRLVRGGEVIGEYDEKTGIIKSLDGRTNYVRIKEDGSLRWYDTGLEELGFDTSDASDSFFQKGAFADGFDIEDIPAAFLATGREIGKGVIKGVAGFPDALLDTAFLASAKIEKPIFKAIQGDKFDEEKFDEAARKLVAWDIINEDAVGDFLAPDLVGKYTEHDSSEEAALVGKKFSGAAESAGQLLTQFVLSKFGLPWWGTSAIYSAGGEAENAMAQGATVDQAAFSAGASAAAEIITEKMFGFYKFQGKAVDDGLKTLISANINNKILRNAANLGLTLGGDALEEELSEFGSAAAKKMSYMSDKELNEIFTKEDALDTFISSLLLSGTTATGKVISSSAKGLDYATQLSANDKTLVDKLYKDAVAEAEKDGKKLGYGEKNELYEDIRQALDEGDIDVDVIEEVLGGESYEAFRKAVEYFNNSDDYKAYQEADAEEKSWQKEYDDLSKIGEDLGQTERLAELRNKLEGLKTTSRSKELRAKLDPAIKSVNDLKAKMRGEVIGKVKNDRLAESYRELVRSQQEFTADVSKITNETAKKTVQNILDSKLANATRKHRKLVDMLVKLSEDKGIEFDLTSNKNLKGTEHDKGDGIFTNGFVVKDGKGGIKVTLNIDSPKLFESTVGHEVGHTFEGTKLYNPLQKAVFEAAEAKGDFQKRLKDTEDLYAEHDPDADAKQEITSDLLGELIFNDRDFIMNLSTKRRNVFLKMYDEVKYFAKIATEGSAEARKIEKAKKLFAEAYRNPKSSKDTTAKTQNSLSVANSKTDSTYLDAVNRGDMNTAQRMVEEFGKTAGYDTTMFHETDADNIHIFDISRGTHGGTDYQTPYGIFTKSSAKNIGLGSKQMKLFVKAENTLRVEDRDDVLNKIPGFAKYYDQIQAIDQKYDAISEQLADEEFDALQEWMEANPDADMDVVYPTSYIMEGKPADIDSERYQEAHRKYQENHQTWQEEYNAVAVKAKEFITNYLRSNGYDSMYFKIDGGSRGRQTDSLIVLDENQVKSADAVTYDDNGNVIPLSERFNPQKDDIRYSISTDSEGKKLSKGQQEFFKDSKMRDDSGHLIPMYHGTQKGGYHIFDPNYSDDGISLFFVDRNDVAMSYSGTSETYAARTFRTADDFNNFFAEIGTPEYEVQEKNGKLYLYDDGDLVAESENGEEIYEEFRDLSGLGYGDVNYKVYLDLKNPYVVDAKGSEWNELHDRDVSIYYHGDEASPVTTREIARYASDYGYDGVILKNIRDNGGFSNGSEGASTVAIAFESNQVKSVANTNPTGNSDIRYSLTDTNGKTLTKKQQDFFKDSVVRDENGNLKVMYHGTSNGGYTVFDTYGGNHGLFGVGSYFTDSKNIGESYTKKGKGTNPQVYEVYLDIRNPLDMDAQANPAEWAKAFEDVDFPEYGTNEDFYRAVEEFYADQWMSKWEVAEEIQSTIESGMGYDGITHIGGGRVNPNGERHRVYIAFQPEQIKDIGNDSPTTDPDIRYSLTADTKLADNAIKKNKSFGFVDSEVMTTAKALRESVANRLKAMKEHGVAIPDDVRTSTAFGNSAYGGVSEENTTICPRSLAAEAFVDAVSEYLGRPLSVAEQIYISQDLQGRSLTPECTYCYVATDRKAYRAFLGEYIKQRDTVINKLKANPNADLSRSGELYNEFRAGRKDTDNMYNRFKMWTDAYKNGKPMIEASHLASMEKLMGDINSQFGAELKPQIVDAMKYAQSASWAKKRVSYATYDGHILKWKQSRIDDLNSHYGLRMYSFSDFHPAFVLENMQMITDAAVRGLKMLGYTKDTDFVEIFAPTGMNINISTFGFESGGNVYENNIIGAEWEKAKKLRAENPNVGITFVATNDALVEWALKQDWIDVVIPYHLVRTGAEVAKAFNYHNYTDESSDVKDEGWSKDTDKKYIAPTEHNNDKATYLAALQANHLKPRFERFLGNENYMKLVNECRQPASESKPVQPVFGEDAINTVLAKLQANGFYQPVGGSVDRMYEIAAEVAENMTQQIAPVQNSLSYADDAPASRGYGKNRGTLGSDIRLRNPSEFGFNPFGDSAMSNDIAPTSQPVAQPTQPVRPTQPAQPVAKDIAPTREYEAIRPQKEKQPKMVRVDAPVAEQPTAQILTEEPQVKKGKMNILHKAAELFVDKGAVFERLAKKTKNRELEGKYNFMHYSNGNAQNFIGNGAEGVKSLKSIVDQVENSGKTHEFSEYMYHLHNSDRMTLAERGYGDNKAVFGDHVTAVQSLNFAQQIESKNPEFRQLAVDIYNINRHLRQMMVDAGVISQETADLWQNMYPHYVPIRREGYDGVNINVPLDTNKTGVNAPVKRATGGNSNILPMFDTMAQRILQTYRAVDKNRFGVELKNTLGTTIAKNIESIDGILDNIDKHEELLQKGKNGNAPTFTVFENGEKVTFEITDEMYDAMKPTSDALAYTNKALNTVSNVRRGLITEYNPVFLATNAIKDAQDVLINSQHPVRTYANMPKAWIEMLTNGKMYQEYLNNGGDQNTYFEKDSNTFTKEKSKLRKVVGFPLDAIAYANNFIERVPRLAEYMASRKQGRSIQVSMLDAARVTTNFAAGGDVTKLFNRNGATFLNASVQGAAQQWRNIQEARMEGFKGWAKLAGKTILAGLPAVLLNGLLWDDDEEYEELSDYVKENYYIVGKFGDGQFVRIPKGRTVAVIQEALQQVWDASTGDDEIDGEKFMQLVLNNLAPNSPLDNNVASPFIQAFTNKAWHGGDIVPQSMQDVPAAEQYDESTDMLSRWFGEKFDVSPMKVNYLLDQYSGGIGDTFLPMMTPEAERGTDSFAGKMVSPWVDKFTTDSVLNNQNVTDFYDLKDSLTINANSSKATDDDILKSKYMSSVNAELSNLYKLKRDIQNSNKLSDRKKFAESRKVQEQINETMKSAMATYENISYEEDVKTGDRYAIIGDKYFRLKEDEYNYTWETLNDDAVAKYKITSAAGDSNYATDGTTHYAWKEPDDDSDDKPSWRKLTDSQVKKQKEVTKKLGITPDEYWSNRDEDTVAMYDWVYDNPEKFTVAEAVTDDFTDYWKHKSIMDEFDATDDYGKTVSGLKKQRVREYIYGLDIDEAQKHILYKSMYKTVDDHNYEIIEYLNSRDDISYGEMKTILTELGFKVSKDGVITWD